MYFTNYFFCMLSAKIINIKWKRFWVRQIFMEGRSKRKFHVLVKKTGAIWSPVLLQAVFYNPISRGTLSGWRYGVIIGPFLMASFVK